MNTNPWVRVRLAFGGMRVGHTFQPTGVFRDRLLRAGLIEIIKSEDVAEAAQDKRAEVQLPRRSKASRKVEA
jgi:hypothetical protein